ncbi:type I polyketide synthase, partial [Streptomyces sp. NPDC058829]
MSAMHDDGEAPGAVPRQAIAVVGMACRLPQAPDPQAFWRLLRDGRDAVTTVPEGRWLLPGAGGDTGSPLREPGTHRGGFLDQVDAFDADFFGISPREAAAMDPQQRLMLELSWEALEDAGIVPGDLSGGSTGVFTGVMGDDYAALARRPGPGALTRHSLTGLNRGIIANRISFTLGLTGPSITVDTGQSSSLVAVHLACESLRSGASALALAGGVQLNLAAENAVGAARFGALSPDGRCFTFDARANGYVRGEGGGVVVLKPLEQAVADGDSVYCVILGSATNNDGATDGLTRPSPDGQAAVLRAAHRASGVEPGVVAYVELHGTGTRAGDPVEAAALGAVFGATRPAGRALRVGSVKTNIGHLEGAAGIAGLLKAALSISHGLLPPSLNFERPHPDIPLDDLGLSVQRELTDWPAAKRRVAGVSSFGMGGTNCHMVLAEPPPPTPSVSCRPEERRPAEEAVALVVSARTPGALRGQAARLRAHLAERPELPLSRVADALVTTRTVFPRRAVVTAGSRRTALEALEALAGGAPHPALVTGHHTPTTGGTVFLLPGQGCQYPGMARTLYHHPRWTVFRDALDQACHALDPHLDTPLREVMFAEPGTPHATLLTRTDYTQPALFALTTALYHQITHLGPTPTHLIGHSIGEITAAHLTGTLTLQDAALLITTRGRLMHTLPTHTTGMLATHTTHNHLQTLLADHPGITIAAHNSPTDHVLAGDLPTLTHLHHHLKTHNIPTRLLNTSHAFHSPHMDPVLDDFHTTAATLTYHPPTTPVISTLTTTVV